MSELQPEAQADDLVKGTFDDGVDEQESGLASQDQPEAKAEGAELATAESEETEKNTDDGDSHDEGDSVQRAINKQHRKFREEERKRLALEKELEEARKQLEAKSTTVEDVEIPPIPDPWDDDFDLKVKAREEAIQRKAQADYQRQLAEDQAFRTQQEQELKRQRETQEKLETYAKRAAEQGIKEQDLIAAANRVADAGVQPDVANFLLTDSDGPAITAYLADDGNIMELYELAEMNPVAAGMKLNEIRAKAIAMKPKASSAPPPPETINGRGAVEKVSPFIAKAKFE